MKKKKELRRFDLNKPFNPSDIKNLNEEELNLLANDVRENIINNWDPVPKIEESKRAFTGGLNTSPDTCFQSYSSISSY